MDHQIKKAHADAPIHHLLEKRWSPYVFSDEKISNETLKVLFEAARWAPSSYNDQPWRYIIATKEQPEIYEKIFTCLVEGNQTWAGNAYVLALGVIMKNLSQTGKPNRAALHDLGAASMSLTLEALKQGLFVHQMIGIIPQKVKETFNLPDDAEAYTALAIGHVCDSDEHFDKAADVLKECDHKPRERKPLDEIIFHGSFGEAFKFDLL
ncbi:MAG: nitroreductase [Gammaproteobacteria bacterium]|nr:MAG: nitroreductase [Gammaproteobacteria bacterium]UTW43707.1 nitroreductase family protein [bacterium SCSIO 12844]